MSRAARFTAALLCAAAIGVCAGRARAAGQVGDVVPQYSLVGIDGLPYTAAQDVGRVVFVFLFGYS